jgi:quercetin dioxygenase-like cupin family protein
LVALQHEAVKFTASQIQTPRRTGAFPTISLPTAGTPVDIVLAPQFPCVRMGSVIVPNDGPMLSGPFGVVVKVRAEHTNAIMSVIEETIPPGSRITPHTHQNDVWVYVLAGEIGVLVGDTVAQAYAGSWVLKPRNVVHAMWNPGLQPAQVMEVLTPGGSERWFEELASLLPGDSVGFEEACHRHGIRFLTDSTWTAELRQRFNLR